MEQRIVECREGDMEHCRARSQSAPSVGGPTHPGPGGLRPHHFICSSREGLHPAVLRLTVSDNKPYVS